MPLARDLVTYSVSAAPREMQDPRATARDLARVLKVDARELQRRFAARPRFLWVSRRVDPHQGMTIAVVEAARRLRRDRDAARVSARRRGERDDRAHCNVDHVGVDGLELQLDEELRGRPGWTTRCSATAAGARSSSSAASRAPENGRHVVLTLDADLQSIVEAHLARAVDSLRAVRGFALFLDPRTGEVLASVNVPHLPPGKARNWNFTDQFEPGSTFKVVVAGAALEEGLARPDQVFEASADGQRAGRARRCRSTTCTRRRATRSATRCAGRATSSWASSDCCSARSASTATAPSSASAA